MGLCSECSEITAGGELDSTPKEAHPATIPGKTPGLPRSRTGGMGDSFAVVLVRCQDSTNAGVGVVPELTNAARPFCLAAVLTRPARRAAVFVGPACRAGHRGLPRAVRRGSQQNALNSSVNHTHSGVRYVLPCELGSASPNVHSGRMDLLILRRLPVGLYALAECGGLSSQRIGILLSRHACRSERFQQTAFGVVHGLRFMQNFASLRERRAAGDRIQHNDGPSQSLRPHLTTSPIIKCPRRMYRKKPSLPLDSDTDPLRPPVVRSRSGNLYRMNRDAGTSAQCSGWPQRLEDL